jgi:UDP-N-acetylmuramyl pentapeptide synthase
MVVTIILLSTFAIFFDQNLEIIIFPTLFYFLVIQNIFVFWKILRNKLLKPKNTARLLFTKIITIVLILFLLYFVVFWWYEEFIYLFLIILMLFTPLCIFISIFISLPIVNYLKNKKINNAINKSKNINRPVKIWITWSYWKSSVKEFLSYILKNEWEILKTPKNINSELWVSELILNKLSNKFDYFIAEMWAYKIWEIEQLWEIVNHKYWFLTAIWNQHIWLFWNQKNINKAKKEITKKIFLNDWILYINWDNKNIQKLKFKKWLNIVKYWTNDYSDAIWNFIKFSNDNIIFNFKYKDINETFETNVLGKHNIINLTWIIAFCIDLWISKEKIKKYILNLKTSENTLKLFSKKLKNYELKIIDDSYNLSYDWLFAWIYILNNYI